MDSSSNNSSPGLDRFATCRWHKDAENGTPEHCTHRDVLPMAGTAGFAADAWCTDCAYYKAKRVPRKRQPEPPPPPQDLWRRW